LKHQIRTICQVLQMITVLKLPSECVEMIVERMDEFTRLCFSMVNKECLYKFYSKEDAEMQRMRRRYLQLCLEDCHKMIRKVHNNNVLSGWCETCDRQTLLRSQIYTTYGKETIRWVCIDRCAFRCASCLALCAITNFSSERWFKRYGVCGPCMIDILPQFMLS